MNRLTSPVGTVVEVPDDLAEKLARRGWHVADDVKPASKSVKPVKSEAVKPAAEPVDKSAKRKPGRPRK